MDKADLRKKAKDIRRGLDITELSSAIRSQIARMKEFQRAQNVLLYYPLEFELDLLSLCDSKKNFYLPRIEGENLLVCPYECGCELKTSCFKTLEPCSAPVSPEIIDFAIVPCLMADRQHFRLGYGGGFYDKFLPQLRHECVKIAAVANKLIVHELPVEKFDLPVDFVVTEKSVF